MPVLRRFQGGLGGPGRGENDPLPGEPGFELPNGGGFLPSDPLSGDENGIPDTTPEEILKKKRRGPHDGQGSEGPRDRPSGNPFHGGAQATPSMPSQPSPLAGNPGGAVTPPPAPPPMQPFQPLPSVGAAGLAAPSVGRRSLFGSQGGLQGGGLGVPLDAVPNDKSDEISSLIQMLQKRNGGSFGGGF